jgi:protocatechuate 3,4-dioxygenase beta subunit
MLQAAFAVLLMQAATVQGSVSKLGTNEPVPKVSMELRSMDSDTVQYSATTTDEGKFSFRSVRPGKYRVRASRQGYVRVEYGQRKSNGRGTPIDIAAGQSMPDLHVTMTPTAAIAGRIYDDKGQPIVKATVQAMKVGYANGKRSLTVMQTALANDLGEYRLFWLPPGQYYLSAVMPDWNISGDNVTLNAGAAGSTSSVQGSRFSAPVVDPVALSGFPPGSPVQAARYLPVFYPNTTDEDAATAIDAGPAAILTGMDIQLIPVRTRRVRGVVIDGDTGKPPTAVPQPAQLIAFPRTTGSGPSPFVNPTTGAFELQIMQAPTVVSGLSGLKSGRISLPYGETDIDNLQVVVTSGFRITGQIAIEGPANVPMSALRVTVRAEPQGLFTATPPPESGVPDNRGAFTLQNVIAGTYRLNINPVLATNSPTVPSIPAALQTAYVKSIQYGDTDVLNGPLHIEGTPNLALSIVIGTNAAPVTGLVFNERQEPLSDVTVVLVPSNRTRQDLFRSAMTDSAGKFKLDRVPPGDYKAFALDDVENGAWFDEQFLRRIEQRGVPFHMGDSPPPELRLFVSN